jgi:hypothetical protein
MKIKVVRDAVPPLRYADIEVGEAFVYAACPSSVFIRTSADEEMAEGMLDYINEIGCR